MTRKRGLGRGKGTQSIDPAGKGVRRELYLRPPDLEKLSRTPGDGWTAKVRWLLELADSMGLLERRGR